MSNTSFFLVGSMIFLVHFSKACHPPAGLLLLSPVPSKKENLMYQEKQAYKGQSVRTAHFKKERKRYAIRDRAA